MKSQDICQIIIAFGTLISAVLILYNFWKIKKMKSFELAALFNKRYEEIRDQANRANNEYNENLKHLYSKYWELQFTQYQFFKKGLVDSNIYCFWVNNKKFKFNNQIKLGPYTLKESWEQLGAHNISNEFNVFMNCVFQNPNPYLSKKEILRLKRKVKKISGPY
jgi:hypothetical protein